MSERTLSEARERFLLATENKGARPATLMVYRLYTAEFMSYATGQGYPDSLSTLDIEVAEDWLAYRRRVGRRNGAVAKNQAAAVAKCWSTWLWRRHWLDRDPLAMLVRPQYEVQRRRSWTYDEMRRIMAAATAGVMALRNRALLLLMLNTGCRIGELLAADLEDLDTDGAVITFRFTKNRRPRTVVYRNPNAPDGGRCAVAVRSWLDARVAQHGVEAIFTSHTGARLTYEEVRAVFRLWGRVANVTPCTPHISRHTAASEFLAERPGARAELRERIGHLDEASLRFYEHVTSPAALVAAEVASLADRWSL